MTQFYFRSGDALSDKDNSHVQVGKLGKSGYLTRAENCGRCGGQGGSPHWRPDGGVCYQCNGNRTISRTHRVYTEKKLWQLNVSAEQSAQRKVDAAKRKAEKRRQEFIAWAKPHGKLIGGILLATGNSFLTDIARKLHDHYILSDKQIAAADNAIEQAAYRLALDSASQFVGLVKERIEFEAIVVGVYGTEGYYGHTDIVRFRDLDGNLFTWFASGYSGLDRSDRISITGTVKKHETYRGINQTILTRCKWNRFEIVAADDAANLESIA